MRAEAARRLQSRYEEVSRRYRNGESHRAIGRATGLDRKTVRKYIQSADIPKRAERRPVARNLDPFIDYLGDRRRAVATAPASRSERSANSGILGQSPWCVTPYVPGGIGSQ